MENELVNIYLSNESIMKKEIMETLELRICTFSEESDEFPDTRTVDDS
jgi:hypothetical protein